MWAVIVAVYLLDQASKYLALAFLQEDQSIPLIRGVFHITFVRNTGAAFGLLKSQPHLFVIIAFLAISFMGYLLVKKPAFLRSADRFALSLILGGTAGNLTDRLRFGHVIDFLDLRIWPVFNIADSAITAGAVILGLSMLGMWGKRIEGRR